MNGYKRFFESDYHFENVDGSEDPFQKLINLEDNIHGITYPYKKTIDIPKDTSFYDYQFSCLHRCDYVKDFTVDFTGDISFMHYTFDEDDNEIENRLPTFPKAFFVMGFPYPFIRFNFTDDTRPETITITFTAFLFNTPLRSLILNYKPGYTTETHIYDKIIRNGFQNLVIREHNTPKPRSDPITSLYLYRQIISEQKARDRCTIC